MVAYLSNEGRYTIFRYGDGRLKFIGPYSLERYTEVKEWDQGYATEMTYALMDYCFHELGLHRVNALCNPENGRSRRVLEKCGLRLEAHYREKCRYVRNGEAFWQDELEYALLKKEAEQ